MINPIRIAVDAMGGENSPFKKLLEELRYITKIQIIFTIIFSVIRKSFFLY